MFVKACHHVCGSWSTQERSSTSAWVTHWPAENVVPLDACSMLLALVTLKTAERVLLYPYTRQEALFCSLQITHFYFCLGKDV